MTGIMNWLDGVFSQLLPTDIYTKLDYLYNATIIALGSGIILMLLAMTFIILSVRNRKAED